jgi:hypothetical protein
MHQRDDPLAALTDRLAGITDHATRVLTAAVTIRRELTAKLTPEVAAAALPAIVVVNDQMRALAELMEKIAGKAAAMPDMAAMVRQAACRPRRALPEPGLN